MLNAPYHHAPSVLTHAKMSLFQSGVLCRLLPCQFGLQEVVECYFRLGILVSDKECSWLK